jgi:hypothetical protein
VTTAESKCQGLCAQKGLCRGEVIRVDVASATSKETYNYCEEAIAQDVATGYVVTRSEDGLNLGIHDNNLNRAAESLTTALIPESCSIVAKELTTQLVKLATARIRQLELENYYMAFFSLCLLERLARLMPLSNGDMQSILDGAATEATALLRTRKPYGRTKPTQQTQ